MCGRGGGGGYNIFVSYSLQYSTDGEPTDRSPDSVEACLLSSVDAEYAKTH